MIFNVDSKDVELYRSASYGFKGFFDERGGDFYTDEMYREAHDWTSTWLDKIYKSETLDEFIKSIPLKIKYSLDIKDGELWFTFNCPNGLIGQYTFGVELIYALVK